MTDTTRRLLGVPLWSHRGTSRLRPAPVVDPDLIRNLDVGQAGYIYRGGVTYVQVKRLVAAPAALTGTAASALPGAGQRPGPEPLADPSALPGPRPLSDVSVLLDEAFGPEAPS